MCSEAVMNNCKVLLEYILYPLYIRVKLGLKALALASTNDYKRFESVARRKPVKTTSDPTEEITSILCQCALSRLNDVYL